MNDTLRGLRPLIPIGIQQMADELVRRSYRARLERAGEPECELCGSRRHPDASIADACERCGHVEERDCERVPVLVQYAVPVGNEDEGLPI